MQGVTLSFLAALAGVQASPIQKRNGTTGCGTPHNFIGSTDTFSIPSSGGDREYRIHLPSNLDVNKPTPLLIAYHGSGDNPTDFEGTTRFSDETINPDMITVYPKGVNGNWEGPTYAQEGVSDKVFTTDLVSHLSDRYCIDTSRIYASGHSNGAGFVGTLACSPDHGDVFAGFAPVSGAFYTDVTGNDTCHPARSPYPMFEAHGGSDQTIFYEGGEGRGGPLPGIADWVSRWAQRDACGEPTVEDLGNGVHHTSYSCGGKDGLLQHYKVDQADHPWLTTELGLDVSPLVIEFLSNQQKPT